MTLTTDDLKSIRERLEADVRALGSLPVSPEDLTSDVMLRLLSANTSRPISSPCAYARTILRNLVRDRIRELERAQRALDVLARRRHKRVERRGRYRTLGIHHE